MNLYTSRNRWKWLLFFSALVAFIVVIHYSHLLLSQIAQEERKRVSLWAEAITQKAQLVNHTTTFFNEIKVEEGKRASQLAMVLQKLFDASLNDDVTFYVDMLQSNKTIPLILTRLDGTIDYTANVTPQVAEMKNVSELGPMRWEYDSVMMQYDAGLTVIMYYKESKIYTDLRVFLEDLQESFFQEVVINTASIPVIITDSTEQNVLISGNIDSTLLLSAEGVRKMVAKMKSENAPIPILLPEQGRCFVFYEESSVLTHLRYFPYIQFVIIIFFVIVAYLLFSMARRSEQNRVWVGMSKETAHQLGTPISSLMAWMEILRESEIDADLVEEMNKDVERLDTIAQRFSKIGSIPELHEENIVDVIDKFISYLKTRISSKAIIQFDATSYPAIILPINRYLFEWVIENLCKNAVDAMEGNGLITIAIIEEENSVHIDITDTGKGIPPKKYKAIFKPGYTSKSRGWGLGLTLAQRIIKEYHKGKLFVKSSVVGEGTTMRITLRR